MHTHTFPRFSFIFGPNGMFSSTQKNLNLLPLLGWVLNIITPLSTYERSASYNAWTKFSPLLVFIYKFYWNTAKFTQFMYCCFWVTIGNLSSCDREYMAGKA